MTSGLVLRGYMIGNAMKSAPNISGVEIGDGVRRRNIQRKKKKGMSKSGKEEVSL